MVARRERWARWTVGELSLAAQFARDGWSSRQIGDAIGRTPEMVQHQLQRLGVPLCPSCTRRPGAHGGNWTPEEDATALAMLSAGAALKDIGAACGGRSVNAVSARFQRRGIPVGRLRGTPRKPCKPTPHTPSGETADDLERIIEEQRRCLPVWWAAEEERMRRLDELVLTMAADEVARELSATVQRGRCWKRRAGL